MKGKSHEHCQHYMYGGKCWKEGLEKVDDECPKLRRFNNGRR